LNEYFIFDSLTQDFLLTKESIDELIDSIVGLGSYVLNGAEVLSLESSLRSLHRLELHNLRSNVFAFELQQLFLNQKFSILVFLFSVKGALLPQLLCDVLRVNNLLLLFGTENSLVETCHNSCLVDFVEGHLGSVFCLFDTNIEFISDLVLLLLQLRDLFVVNIDLLFYLEIGLFFVVVEKSGVLLDQAI